MKYLSDLFKIVVFVSIMYMPLAWWSIQDSMATIDRIAEEETITKLTNAQKVTQSYLEKGDMLEACMRLDAEMQARNIATYTVIGPESSCYKPDGMSSLPPLQETETMASFVVKGIALTFVKYETGDFKWAISVHTPQTINIIERLKTNIPLRKALLSDFLLVIYTVFTFILCAVLVFAESIQNRYRKDGKDPVWIKVLSKVFSFLQLNDLKIIKSATTALVKQNEDLNKDIDLLQTSLEHSILNEIKKNNHNIPYTFFGTVSKVDINGFSKVVSAIDASGTSVTEQLTLSLENFGCELLQRYEGLFEKTIGDEIVVVFKQSDSALRAAAFSRDLMFEFSQIAFTIDNDHRKFTLKSAIYSSDITFSKRTAGYGFLGTALTFTTRLMDAVTIKDKNVLCLTEAQSTNVADLLALPKNTEEFKFKNMPVQRGYQVTQFTDLPELSTSEKFNDCLMYFRADRHIIFLLNQLSATPIYPENILKSLFSIQVNKTSEEVIQTWIKAVETFKKEDLTSAEKVFVLAQVIMLGKNLVPTSQWGNEATKALLTVPRQIQGRLNASVIEVLMDKDAAALSSEDQNSFVIANDPSGRTQGNLLVFRAAKKLDNQIFDELLKMIKSPQANISKSGIYAACQIIQYYKVHSPAELETYSSYAKIIQLLHYLKASKKAHFSERLHERLQSL